MLRQTHAHSGTLKEMGRDIGWLLWVNLSEPEVCFRWNFQLFSCLPAPPFEFVKSVMELQNICASNVYTGGNMPKSWQYHNLIKCECTYEQKDNAVVLRVYGLCFSGFSAYPTTSWTGYFYLLQAKVSFVMLLTSQASSQRFCNHSTFPALILV